MRREANPHCRGKAIATGKRNQPLLRRETGRHGEKDSQCMGREQVYSISRKQLVGRREIERHGRKTHHYEKRTLSSHYTKKKHTYLEKEKPNLIEGRKQQ